MIIVEKYIAIAKGLIKTLLPNANRPPPTGGSDESLYCYGLWLRQLKYYHHYYKKVPVTLLEIGPGDSLGTGLAALLSGCDYLIAVDMYPYFSPQQNVQIFDELVTYFKNKKPIPGKEQYPLLIPFLENYEFPGEIITDKMLAVTLAPARLQKIRDELLQPGLQNKYVRFFMPFSKVDVAPASIDFIFSQSVLQFTNLNYMYDCMHYWLKKGGAMAHAIDFSALGITKKWNGHWAFKKWEWKLYSFGKKMLLNRSLLSDHLILLKNNSFKIVDTILYKNITGLTRDQVEKDFKKYPTEDLETGAAYILSEKC